MSDLLWVKAKREEIGNNSFGCDEKTERFFFHTNVFKPRDQKQKMEFFIRFPRKQRFFFEFRIHVNGVMKRNRVKKKNQKRRVKQNEKPFFQDTEKDKKHGT